MASDGRWSRIQVARYQRDIYVDSARSDRVVLGPGGDWFRPKTKVQAFRGLACLVAAACAWFDGE